MPSDSMETSQRIIVPPRLLAVRITCEGAEISRHDRSFVPADVVQAPAHGREIRLAREAADRLAAGDVELPARCHGVTTVPAMTFARPSISEDWGMARFDADDVNSSCQTPRRRTAGPVATMGAGDERSESA